MSEVNLPELDKAMSSEGAYPQYTDEQLKNLAAYIKQCKVDKKDLASTKSAYESCSEKKMGELLWWQTPVGVISIGLGGLALGILVGTVAK